MTNLTEQWKKGKLPSRYYYIRVRELLGLYIDYYNAETDDWDANYPKNIETIIASVPSYEQWQEKLEENTRFKKLLKECKERLIYCTISTQDVQAKINQVLGEE